MKSSKSGHKNNSVVCNQMLKTAAFPLSSRSTSQ